MFCCMLAAMYHPTDQPRIGEEVENAGMSDLTVRTLDKVESAEGCNLLLILFLHMGGNLFQLQVYIGSWCQHRKQYCAPGVLMITLCSIAAGFLLRSIAYSHEGAAVTHIMTSWIKSMLGFWPTLIGS